MGLTGSVLEGLTGAFTRDVPFSEGPLWQSLHSADPGSSGANEVTTGSGAEGRQAVSFTAGSSGSDALAVTLTFTVLGAQTVRWVGYWSAQTGGTWLGGFPLASTGKVAVGLSGGSQIYCPAHGLSVGQAVRVNPIPGVVSALPNPLGVDIPYYVTQAPTLDSVVLIETGSIPITLTSSAGFALAVDLSQTTGAAGGQIVFGSGVGAVYSSVS